MWKISDNFSYCFKKHDHQSTTSNGIFFSSTEYYSFQLNEWAEYLNWRKLANGWPFDRCWHGILFWKKLACATGDK